MSLRTRRIKTETDFGLRLVEGLRVAARRPNIYGYIPHDRQMIFHTSTARKKLFVGGNRSGKTVGGATEAVWWMTGTHPFRETPPPPTYGRIVTTDYTQGLEKIVKPEIARWLPPSALKGGSWEDAYDKELRTLYLDNGSFAEFMSYEQAVDKFAGTSRHWEWFDEEPPEDVFNECLMRLVDVGGSYWITMTPVEGMTWTYDRIYECTNPTKEDYDPDILVVEVVSDMNPHLNPGELDILTAGFDKEDKKARLQGQYIQRGGLIYPNFDEDVHTINPIDPRSLDLKNWMHFEMMDHGHTNLTAWHWGAVNREGKKVIYAEYTKSGEVVKVHAAAVKQKRKELEIIPSYSVGDPSIRNVDPITGTSIQIEYIDHGIPIILGNNDFVAGSNMVRTGFDDPASLYITKNNVNLIWELKRYRYKTWANKKTERENNPKEEPQKKNDHSCDALRYGVASRPRVEDLSIPENFVRNGPPRPVNPYDGRTDPGTRVLERDRVIVDDILGSEW